MSSRRRVLSMAAFGFGLLAVVFVVAVFGFPSLSQNEGSASALGCAEDPRKVVLPLGVEAPDGRWQQVRRFPIAQAELRAAALGSTVYVGGGLRAAGSALVSTGAIFAFDSKSSTYTRLSPLPRRVDHPAFVTAGNALYVIGGYHDGVPTSDVFRYSPKPGTWTRLPPMDVPRGSPAAAAVGGKIYVIGGTVGPDDEPTGLTETFDLATRRWSRAPDMPTPRHHARAAAVDGAVYVVGGRGNRDDSLDTVERFDLRRTKWEEVSRLPLGAGALAVVRARGRVIAIGGGNDDERWVTPATWSFGPRTNRWRRLADLRTARHGHAAAVAGGRIYVFGGAPCPEYGVTDSVERLDAFSGTRSASRRRAP